MLKHGLEYAVSAKQRNIAAVSTYYVNFSVLYDVRAHPNVSSVIARYGTTVRNVKLAFIPNIP